MGIIYQAKNTITGKSYIGQTTKKLTERKRKHYNKANSRPDTYFLNALRKHGFENFEWTILVEGKTIDELNLLEPEYIEKLGTLAPDGYNLTTGGKNGRCASETRKKMSIAHLGKKATDITKKRMSIAQSGRKVTPEHRQKLRIANLGKKLTDETKRKISIAEKGENNHMYGKKHTSEAKQKMSLGHLGKKLTDEHRKNIGVARLGKKHTDVTKQKMSGERNGNAKLLETQVLQIRRELTNGVSCSNLAREFRLNVSTIYRIKHNQTWNHLKNSEQ